MASLRDKFKPGDIVRMKERHEIIYLICEHVDDDSRTVASNTLLHRGRSPAGDPPGPVVLAVEDGNFELNHWECVGNIADIGAKILKSLEN